MEVTKVETVLSDLENHIKKRESFSLIRFGDGGIKFIHSILYNDWRQLQIIMRKEGIPLTRVLEVFELWGFYARQADYIDTPQVYFDGNFWPRLKKPPNKPMSKETVKRLKMWEELYNCAEFDNNNYCNPEIHFLMITRLSRRRKNLLDIMRRRNVCLITNRPEVSLKFRGFCEMTTFSIVGQYENHYLNSFQDTSNFIKENANSYDLWLVSAGEIGRIYSGLIKENGGRSVDIGFVTDYWIDNVIPIRLQPFIETNLNNPLELKLTRRGAGYRRFL